MDLGVRCSLEAASNHLFLTETDGVSLTYQYNIMEVFAMSKLISCEFNTDTACAELLFADGCLISIDCIAVENEVADDCFDCAELDWLIYNKPLEYADLILNGGIEEYCKGSRDHSSLED